VLLRTQSSTENEQARGADIALVARIIGNVVVPLLPRLRNEVRIEVVLVFKAAQESTVCDHISSA
jgi:hypothetical protein